MSSIIKSGPQPIIILGAGRSGTKFLRSLLAVSPECKNIPYDINYIWRFGNEATLDDELSIAQLSPEIKKYIRSQIDRYTSDSNNQHNKFVIEKTVSNTLRVAFVNAVFPHAKFIHLIRDGRAVTESAMRQWQEPPNQQYLMQKLKYFPWRNYAYAIKYVSNIVKRKVFGQIESYTWGPRYKNISEDVRSKTLAEVCAIQWRECVERCMSQLATLPSNRYIEVRYEDLVSSPRTIKDLCSFIGISEIDMILKNYHDTVEDSNIGKWQTNLDEEAAKSILNEISPLLEQLGYVE